MYVYIFLYNSSCIFSNKSESLMYSPSCISLTWKGVWLSKRTVLKSMTGQREMIKNQKNCSDF